MDSVVLDGVEYVKAAVAAKKFKYTSDYVGQLCRAKKIDARLVGRSWFVNTDSLVSYKKNKNSENNASEVSAKKAISTKPESIVVPIVLSNDDSKPALRKRVTVGPVIKSKTFKAFANQAAALPKSAERTLRVSYERDQEQLMPEIQRIRTRPAKTIRVENASAKKVRISGSKKQTSYTPSKIPTVALSGKVHVEPLHETDKPVDAEEVTDNKENKANNIAITDKDTKARITKKTQTPIIKLKKGTSKVREVSSTASLSKERIGLHKLSAEADETHKVSIQHGQLKPQSKNGQVETTISFTPATVASKKLDRKPRKKLQSSKETWFVATSPLIAVVLAVVIAIVLFSASSTTILTGQIFSSSTTFSLENIFQIFSLFYKM